MNSFRSSLAGARGRRPWMELLAAIVVLVFATNALPQAPAAPQGAAAPVPGEDLAKLVGPIALYPDDLVGIILPASTNPLQLVQADRFLEKRKADPKLAIDDKWDDAVKSLLNYPDVVKMMSADLDWTSALGEAVVADQGEVLEAIQAFRRKAQGAGNLKSDDKQVVKVEKETIVIQPADPQVIYVPQYNPSTVVVYGSAPYYGYYPTPYPSYYYPYAPGAAMAAGVIWGAAIGAAWSGGHYATHYGGDANINVNRNTNINTGDINRGGGAGQRPSGGSSSAWKSNKQPGQVSSSVGKTAPTARAGDARGGGGGYGGGSAGARPSTQQAGAGGRGGGGDSAFGGYGSGRQTQMDSSRGASSRSSMGASAQPTSAARASASGGSRSASAGGSARSAPSSAGARGGGGGARGGGGGGRGGGGRR